MALSQSLMAAEWSASFLVASAVALLHSSLLFTILLLGSSY
jgi:hypothetical protein